MLDFLLLLDLHESFAGSLGYSYFADFSSRAGSVFGMSSTEVLNDMI